MANVMNGINNIYPSVSLVPYYFNSTTFTANQCNNMSTTPVQFLSAPGANSANLIALSISYSSTGSAAVGSSIVNFVNGSNSVIASTTFALGLIGSSVMNTSSALSTGSPNGLYTNINNQINQLSGGTASGTTQTCTVFTQYFIGKLV